MAFSSPDIQRQNDLSNYPTAISCSLAANSRFSTLTDRATDGRIVHPPGHGPFLPDERHNLLRNDWIGHRWRVQRFHVTLLPESKKRRRADQGFPVRSKEQAVSAQTSPASRSAQTLERRCDSGRSLQL
jgi:hypothetical protein